MCFSQIWQRASITREGYWGTGSRKPESGRREVSELDWSEVTAPEGTVGSLGVRVTPAPPWIHQRRAARQMGPAGMARRKRPATTTLSTWRTILGLSARRDHPRRHTSAALHVAATILLPTWQSVTVAENCWRQRVAGAAVAGFAAPESGAPGASTPTPDQRITSDGTSATGSSL